MEDFSNTVIASIKALAVNADRFLKDSTDPLDDRSLAPLITLYGDLKRPWAKLWVGRMMHDSSNSIILTPAVLRIVCNYLLDMESFANGFPHSVLIDYRKRIIERINHPKPGDQVPDYLRNLPKDDDEAIKEALDRFLREYEKDKKEGK